MGLQDIVLYGKDKKGKRGKELTGIGSRRSLCRDTPMAHCQFLFAEAAGP